MRAYWRLAVFALFMLCALPAWAASLSVSLGPSVVALNGPWRFHIGDDPRWSAQSFDDSQWEAVDLTPRAGAHDGDVGLKNYVPGWAARGHRGYTGTAWYRLAVRVADPGSATLWLAGPADVDNAYQIYFNGHLIGGIGDFSRDPPVVVSIQPRIFALPRGLWRADNEGLKGLIAIRVAFAKGSFGSGAPDAGGIHIAPLLGNEKGVGDHVRLQWLQTIEGYAVDGAEAVVFLLLAIMALTLLPLDSRSSFYLWLAAALVLLAIARGNQPFYFLAQIETMREFALWRLVVVDALTLGAWTMAWRTAWDPQSSRWTAITCGVLTAAYAMARLLTLSMFFPHMPQPFVDVLKIALQVDRLGFFGLFCWFAWRGLRRRERGLWFALAALLLVAIGLFAQELGLIGAPGIWFPLGIGVSRTEYAYAAFDVVLFLYLLQRLRSLAPERSVVRAAAP